MNFYDKIRAIKAMKEIKSVAWKITGEDRIKPDKAEVRIEDSEGTVFELVIHPDIPIYRKYRAEEEVLLNVAFSHFGISSGHWIGVNTNINTMVNLCRQKAKYEGTFFVNEDRCSWNGFENPVHVF